MSRDLNDTLIFVKVVECGSFTQAAQRLGLPKTTVSRKVQELETRLDARLIHRTTRKLGLTEAGTVYFEHCQRIANHLDEAENAVHQLQSGPRGWLRITAPYALGLIRISPLLTEFRTRYPDVRVEMILSNDRLDLIAEELDLALRVGPLPDSSLVARKLASFEGQVYAAPDYLARHGEPLSPEDLEHHRSLINPLSSRRAGGRFYWPLSDGHRNEEFPVSPVFVCNDPFGLKPMLLAGDGMMLTSDVVVREELEAGAIRRVLPAWSGPTLDLNAVFPHSRALSPKVRVFVDFLIERLRFERPRLAAVEGGADVAA
jgi:LysR family transcriptional regulator, regulator for bpeEF and oprC